MYLYLKRITSLALLQIGVLTIEDKTFVTLELPWRDNKKNISCIPTGTYKVKKKNSLRLNISGVPNRSAIQMHVGNLVRDTRGCILVGKYLTLMSNQLAICESAIAMKEVSSLIGDNEADLEIVHI